MIRIGKLGLVLVALALGTGCKDQIDDKDAEIKIKAWADDNVGSVKSVSCPKTSMKEGVSFDCTVAFEEGGSYKLTVTQKDDKGNVEWKWATPIVGAEKISEFVVSALQEQRPGGNPKVDCGTGIKEVPADGITCKLDADGEQLALVIKLDGDDVAWEIK